jgi:hypothetical protein
MPMEIERPIFSRSTGNHGTVTKSVSVSSSGNFIEGSEEETEISAEARRDCAFKISGESDWKTVKRMCGCLSNRGIFL